MARAQAHLAGGRFAEAAGAFRAVLAIDSSVLAARLGLADALAARGQRGLAVNGLVEAAERWAEQQPEPALALYGKALALEPGRMELHLDVAVVEHAMGRHDAAIARVEGLAERYMSMGRTDEAAEVLRFVASWEDGAEDEGELTIEDLEVDEATVVARNPLLPPRAPRPAPQIHTETVVCATVLVRPDGSLWLANDTRSGVPKIDEVDPDMVTRVAAPVRAAASQARPLGSSSKTAASQASKPAAPLARPVVSSTKPVAPPPRPAATPARPVAVVSPVVDRLRKRAGLGPEVTAVPRNTQARGTEPIVIRRPSLGRPEDEVTHRFRHPRGAQQAATR